MTDEQAFYFRLGRLHGAHAQDPDVRGTSVDHWCLYDNLLSEEEAIQWFGVAKSLVPCGWQVGFFECDPEWPDDTRWHVFACQHIEAADLERHR